jgi:tRNA threonylcarbamoyl adenosine modification protein (Sua5/YciO/YrdC/YwlC family)
MAARLIEVHPQNPQQRLINQCITELNGGGVIAYPTDSSYALGCLLDNKSGIDRIANIRKLDAQHNYTLLCSDLNEISTYARVDNWQFRLLKSATPGPFTFILKASSEAPRRTQNTKKKTIGVRIPNHPVTHQLLANLDAPLLSATLILPNEALPISEPDTILGNIGHQLDMIIDAGACTLEPTTVVDISGDEPVILRQGLGDFSPYMAV